MRERTLGLDFRRPGSPAQGVQAVPGAEDSAGAATQNDDDDTNRTDDAEDRPRTNED